MRQFDVFVLEDSNESTPWTPPFNDPALGWFLVHDWNQKLNELDAEWIVFAHRSVIIDRDFLNQLAEVNDDFPMVDAIAPQVKTNGSFAGGLLLSKKEGLTKADSSTGLRFVAAPHPSIGVFSRRIIQRTGLFDLDLPPELQLADYALRMSHAGGKMFYVPYLTALASSSTFNHELKDDSDALWQVIYKNLPLANLLRFTLSHISTTPLWLKTKALKNKRDKATDLSKMTAKYIKEISSQQ
ncbi:MAG: hypothetical protein HUK20_06730 [Fibrobacter sp.]|nr:hypothetical protein [Fibrobacter sp.]